MMESLEIEDFKSFKGRHVIGPMKKFTAVVGPNGSGKSNFMDAISFVLGERGQHLRVRKLGDLIYGASVGKPVSNRCRVQMNFIDSDGNRRTFSRAIISSTSSEYRVDNAVVNTATYRQRLREIDINLKAHNFLVYQSTVEKVATQKPKDLTEMLEELSHSNELKSSYERLKVEMQKADSEVSTFLESRRIVTAEKKDAKIAQTNAREYETAREELANKNKDWYLAQIYAIEYHRNQAKEELDTVTAEMDQLAQQKAEHAQQLKNKQKEVRDHFREVSKLDKKFEKDKKSAAAQKDACNQSKKLQDHTVAKIKLAKASRQIAANKASEQLVEIENAERNLEESKQQKRALEQQLAEESRRQQLNLNPEDITEYHRLKAEVEKQTALITTNLSNLNQDQINDRGIIDHEKRRLEHLNDKIKEKADEVEREKELINSMKREKDEAAKQIKHDEKEILAAGKQIVDSKEKIETLNADLTKTLREIKEADVERNETRREQKRREALENLKRLYPDKVYGRLADLCKPSHNKYSVAVTRIIQKHMNSFVCDTKETAFWCISYLRNQRFYPETFLPISTLDVKPISEALRQLEEPEGISLVVDVIECIIPEARKAVQFACGNALVTETVEDARQVAYGSTRQRVVSLNGTVFQTNGVISGGGKDSRARARILDEHSIRRLKEKKQKLVEEIKEYTDHAKREAEIESKKMQVEALKQRIERIDKETENKHEHIRKLKAESESLQIELDKIQPRIDEKIAIVNNREHEKIQKLIDERNQVEDNLFADFCRKINVENIRVYEERELHFHGEMQRQLVECDAQIQKYENELEFLRQDDRKKKVNEQSKLIRQLEEQLAEVKQALENDTAKLEEFERSLEELRVNLEAKRSSAEEAEKEIASIRKKSNEVEKNLHKLDKSKLEHSQIVRANTHQRHDLLHSCKVGSVEIPLLSGSLDRLIVIDENALEDTGRSSASLSQQQSQSLDNAEAIKLDYSSIRPSARRKLEKDEDAEDVLSNLKKLVKDAETKLNKLQAPPTNTSERMEEVKRHEKDATDDCENARKNARKARDAFEKVKAERCERFNTFFEPVSQRIDEVYKRLSQTESAQAYLGPMNQEEPYLDGIEYNCVAPGKSFRPMSSLSGGEKTVAALALLFAIHSSNPSPFFVLDEIDAALDNTNIGKVVQYVMSRSQEDVQVIIISLKEEFFSKAESLVGMYPKDQNPCMASGILTFDLSALVEQ